MITHDRKNEVLKISILTLCLIFGILLLLMTCTNVNTTLGLDDDNVYEETIEKVIKSQFDLDVDLTPNSPEIQD